MKWGFIDPETGDFIEVKEDPRVVAWFSGFKSGIANEVDDWNKTDEWIWEQARRYVGQTEEVEPEQP